MSAATIASSRMSMMDEIAIGRGWFQGLAVRAGPGLRGTLSAWAN
jgi:hypothetical protein